MTSWVVKQQILGAGVSDLHVIDARYYQKSCKHFRNVQRCMTGRSSSTNNSTEDFGLKDMLGAIGADRTKVWRSIDVESLYFDNGGSEY